MGEVLLYGTPFQVQSWEAGTLSPEQWLQRHPEAGLSWPSWPKASQAQQTAGASQEASARTVGGGDRIHPEKDRKSG